MSLPDAVAAAGCGMTRSGQGQHLWGHLRTLTPAASWRMGVCTVPGSRHCGHRGHRGQGRWPSSGCSAKAMAPCSSGHGGGRVGAPRQEAVPARGWRGTQAPEQEAMERPEGSPEILGCPETPPREGHCHTDLGANSHWDAAVCCPTLHLPGLPWAADLEWSRDSGQRELARLGPRISPAGPATTSQDTRTGCNPFIFCPS